MFRIIQKMKNYFKRIIALYARSEISIFMQFEFGKWLISKKHRAEKESALRELWETTHAKPSEDTFRSLNRVREIIFTQKRRILTRKLLAWQMAAAVLVLALVSSVYLTINSTDTNSDLIEQYVQKAETAHITLPDGSRVQMNATSTLLYPREFNGKSRSVYLVGEANFKVAPDKKKPFIVKSNDFQVIALGTEFDIKAYPEDSVFAASVISGSVEVSCNSMSTHRILMPNDQLAYHRYTKESWLTQPDMNEITAWQRGELIFKNISLKEIITVLERKYPYTFVYALNAMKGDKYTFKFNAQATLPEVMNIISRVAGNIQYKIEDNICHILPS